MSWKHALWSAVASVLDSKSTRPGLRILGYHAIGTVIPGDPYGLCCAPAAFERQMELIASGRFGKPVSMSDERGIAITFDDGFQDALTTAAPILAKFGLPFTVCVTPGLLDSGRPYLDWTELAALAKVPGCEIGAHGLTHAKLDALDGAALARELTESRRRLEEAAGRPVTSMTWPHGAASRRTSAAAAAAGFRRAGCSLYGLNESERDPLLLKRVEITGFDNERDFVRKASGGWDWFALRQPDPAAHK